MSDGVSASAKKKMTVCGFCTGSWAGRFLAGARWLPHNFLKTRKQLVKRTIAVTGKHLLKLNRGRFLIHQYWHFALSLSSWFPSSYWNRQACFCRFNRLISEWLQVHITVCLSSGVRIANLFPNNPLKRRKKTLDNFLKLYKDKHTILHQRDSHCSLKGKAARLTKSKINLYHTVGIYTCFHSCKSFCGNVYWH